MRIVLLNFTRNTAIFFLLINLTAVVVKFNKSCVLCQCQNVIVSYKSLINNSSVAETTVSTLICRL